MALITQAVQSIFKKVSIWVYPKVCLNCGAEGQNELDLCTRCYERLPRIPYACKRCALPLSTHDASYCGVCNKREYFFDRAFVPFQFEGFIRDAIYQFKFNQKLNQGKLLAQLLLKYIENKQLTIPDIILPVPLYKKRLRQRGYNQALEIARIICKELDCELTYDEIYRNRDTNVQMKLPAKHRLKNVKDAFSLKAGSTALRNKHICIVDDVMTTANTVNQVAKCVKNAGASQIDVWCIARVSTRK